MSNSSERRDVNVDFSKPNSEIEIGIQNGTLPVNAFVGIHDGVPQSSDRFTVTYGSAGEAARQRVSGASEAQQQQSSGGYDVYKYPGGVIYKKRNSDIDGGNFIPVNNEVLNFTSEKR